MKPVDQTFLDDRDGNCFEACVASILECRLDDLPHLGDRKLECRGWFTTMARAVAERGWHLILTHGAWTDVGENQVADDPGNSRASSLAPPGYAIAGGPSDRCAAGHAIVCLDGAPVHDPHPSRAGLSGPVEEWYLLLPPLTHAFTMAADVRAGAK